MVRTYKTLCTAVTASSVQFLSNVLVRPVVILERSQLWDVDALSSRASPLWFLPTWQSSSCCPPAWSSGFLWRSSCNLWKTSKSHQVVAKLTAPTSTAFLSCSAEDTQRQQCSRAQPCLVQSVCCVVCTVMPCKSAEQWWKKRKKKREKKLVVCHGHKFESSENLDCRQ